MKKKLIAALLLVIAAIAMLTGCEPDPVGEDREPVATTSRIGNFIIEENAPGYDEKWEEVK